MNANTRFGLMGYSGGAIASNWAAALAPSYAPEVNDKLVGFAEGGLFVAPMHNLKYVDGSLVWSGVIPMAIIGVSRSYDIDLQPYLSDYGKAGLPATAARFDPRRPRPLPRADLEEDDQAAVRRSELGA